jgi:hypothetical protein
VPSAEDAKPIQYRSLSRGVQVSCVQEPPPPEPVEIVTATGPSETSVSETSTVLLSGMASAVKEPLLLLDPLTVKLVPADPRNGPNVPFAPESAIVATGLPPTSRRIHRTSRLLLLAVVP